MDGIGLFTSESVSRMVRSHPEHQFMLIFDRAPQGLGPFPDHVTIVSKGPRARHPLLFIYWFEWVIPFILKKYKADLFISTDGFLSLTSEVPAVPVIHDLNFEHFPEFIPLTVRLYYRFFFRRFAAKARRIVTVSDFSSRDIQDQYGISPDLIDVVFNGASENFKPLSEESKQDVRRQYASGFKFFFFIGTLHPRKNIINMLKGFDLFKEKNPDASHRFLIGGRKMWWTSEMEETFLSMKFRNEVTFLGRMDDSELPAVLGAAEALVYIPFFEGFGIPVLEAMKAGVPVVVAENSSLPEVAGDAGIYAEPEDFHSISGALTKVYREPEAMKFYIDKGHQQSLKFSWEKTSENLWTSIEKALKL